MSAMQHLVRDAYFKGFQAAIDAVRTWNDRFGAPEARGEVVMVIAALEALKAQTDLQTKE